MARNCVRAVVGLLICVLVASCSQQQMLNKMISPEDRALSLSAIHDVEKADTKALAGKLHPELVPQIVAVLPQMRAALPNAGREKATLVDGSFVEQVTSRTKNRQTDLSYEISADGRYALAQFTIQREGQSAVITRFYINGLPGSAASLNRFTLAGKSTAQYTVLLLALAAVAVTIAALVRVWRRGRFRRRWLWTIGCLIGVTATSVNWSTGQISFQPIYVELLSAGFTKAGLGPWIISVGIPVIALYVLLFRRGAEYEQPREEDA